MAVLGGGMAGLAAAHELAERGFEVTVFEPKAWGGKARSIPVAGTGAAAAATCPGEHGFRFFPGFYHHIPDTMRRIPFQGNPNGVQDNLVAARVASSCAAATAPTRFIFGIGPDPQAAAHRRRAAPLPDGEPRAGRTCRPTSSPTSSPGCWSSSPAATNAGSASGRT